MKKPVLFLLMIFSLGVILPAVSSAGGRADDVACKLGRGLTNIITGPIELFAELDYGIERYGWSRGVPAGMISGFCKSISRTLAGVYEVVTFPIEYPADFKPVVEPEFVFVSSNEE